MNHTVFGMNIICALNLIIFYPFLLDQSNLTITRRLDSLEKINNCVVL